VVRAVNAGGESGNSNQVQATPRAPSAVALLIVGNSVLVSGDSAIESRLRALGFTTVIRHDSISASADASGKAVIVVSSTITSGNVNTKYRNSAVPVVNWENALHDDFGMTGTTSGTSFGTQTGQTSVSVIDSAHPLAAGLSGTVAVQPSASTFSWGLPGANAAAATRLGRSSSATRRESPCLASSPPRVA
jgi:hypothetical protein